VPAIPRERVRLSSTVVGLYDDENGKFAAVVSWSPRPRLSKVYAERFLVTVGGHPQMLPFGNNDFPGVYAARAAIRLLRVNKIAVGENPIVVGWGHELESTLSELAAHGIKVAAAVDMRGTVKDAMHATPLRAHGRTGVSALTITDRTGARKKIECDAILCAIPLAPGFELAEQGGAQTAFDPVAGVFSVRADEAGRTAAKDVFVAGEIRGPLTAIDAAAAGHRAARAVLESVEAKQ
jgi:sarcosine oxidase subunit alpha